jgi:hypothetical protein
MISGINSTASLAYVPAASRSPAPAPTAGDQVAISLSPETFSSLVQTANSMPEVRGEVVDAFKAQIQAGAYPSSDTLDGLVDLMGGTWAKSAQSGS